jgi:hypothetical protein
MQEQPDWPEVLEFDILVQDGRQGAALPPDLRKGSEAAKKLVLQVLASRAFNYLRYG